MSQPFGELCTLLVNDLYGELCSRIISVLIRYGRIPIGGPNGLLKYSGLSVRELKHGLAVLIQQHLCLYYTDGEHTYYEANSQNAYGLVRSGKYLQAIEDRYGEISREIASNLLLSGHVTVKDLAEAYGIRNNRSMTNGSKHSSMYTDGDNQIKSLGQLHQKLQELEAGGYIVRVDERHFMPTGDIHNEADRKVRAEFRKEWPNDINKKDNEHNLKVKKLKRKWRDGESKTHKASSKINLQNLAAMYPDAEPPPARKKRKVNGKRAISVVSDEEEEPEDISTLLDDDIVFRINFEKCAVLLRNHRLVQFATSSIGPGTSKVYKALLRCLGDSIIRCRDDLSLLANQEEELELSPYSTTSAVAAVLEKDVDLRFGTPQEYTNDLSDGHEAQGSSNDDSDEDATKKNNGRQLSTEQLRHRDIERHLELLSHDPRRFVVNVGRAKWKVNFRSLSTKLLQCDLETTIKDRFGDYGPTAVRIMRDKGKLDEKQISKFAMSPARDVRSTLSKMQQAGYVENQEIPKDNSRQPSRTMYLWFFDEERCRRLVLLDTYKSMGRILQRIKAEKSVVQTVIDKAERLDVVGHEDEYLTTIEKNALRGWLETEEQLLAQLSRQDDLVAVLEDFVMPYLQPDKDDD